MPCRLIRLAVLALVAAAMPAWTSGPLDAVFAGREAAFVVEPAGPGEAVVHNAGMAEQRLPPFSTFKIWNALIALQTGAMPDQHVRLDWDAKRYPLPDWAEGWKRPHDMESAFSVSAVWYFREVAGRIGPERMRDWLDRLGYGNADISSGVKGGRLDDFWNNGSLRVSAAEQARLLINVLAGRSPFDERAVATLRDIALTERGDSWRLYGKTGWGRSRTAGSAGTSAG
jgi:beta-lactamase class D